MCLRCGSALYPDAKFCAECGSPVPASPAADEPPPAPEENIATTEAVLAWEPACPVPGYPSEMRFKKTWRPYQARVLGELAGHLEDRRLHLVAAPGSGKTVLGIEVARQLNQPTLILSPTLAIRDQWIERLTSDFLSDSGATPAWISTDVRRPEFLTVATYQLLHSACGGMVTDDGSEEDETQTEDLDGFETDGDQEAPDAHSGRDRYGVPALLNRLGFRVVILDECHHLRKEWWKSLTETIDRLDAPAIIGLTATPPYDVAPWEWDRYMQVSGPVDAEIAAPELVKEGNLCPHQDYVYISLPEKDEGERISEFRAEVKVVLDEVIRNKEFVRALSTHPWVQHPDDYAEEILADPEYLSSVAIFLNHVDGVVPHELLKVIGVDKKKMPKLNEEWLEILLTGFLFNEPAFQPEHESMAKAIEGRLRRIGAIERRRAILRNTREIRRLLTWSLSKLSSIAEIVREETESLGKDLRMVILTDYIRASELPTGPEDLRRPSRIGVAPIFELIRRLDLPSAKLAAVSGSLVLIPRSCEARFQQIALEEALQGRISTSPLDHDGRYLRMSVQEDLLARLVAVMTRLFGEGEITVLVGTKSLLGEGWDAPPMNSLVLASFVGSYMLSNQMRGRAMRVQPGNPGKTANIWHLVCVEPNNESAGDDFATLSRRFKAFLGVSYHEPVIENGIGRLGIPRPPLHASTVKAKNEDTLRRARDRAGLREAWEAALALGAEGQLVGEIEAPTTSLPRGFVFSNTVMAVLWQGFLIASFVASRFLSAGGSFESIEQYLLYLTIVIVIGAVVMLPFTVKALWLFLKHGSIESSMKQIGEALLHTLIGLGLVKTDRSKLGVVAERTDQPGTVFCHLRGGTTYEKHLYLDALREILDPVENPRYLVERRSWFTMLAQRDYHAVPAIVGTRKAHARMFSDEWRSYVGPTKLIYTRTTKGRRVLLRARQHSLAAAFQKRSERRSAWK